MSRIDRQNGSGIGFIADENCYDGSSSEYDENEDDCSQIQVPPWDMFKCFPIQSSSGSMRDNKFFEVTVYFLKVLVYSLLFILVLCSGIAAKSAVLFATSQLGKNSSLPYCDRNLELEGDSYLTQHTQDSRIKWTWYIIAIFLLPECIGVLNALWHYLFKRKPKMPKKRNILLLLLIETLHAIGLVLLTFVVLPEIGAVQGAAVFSCLCFIPGLLNLLSRNKENLSINKFILYVTLDILALSAQLSGMFLWPLIQRDVKQIFTLALPFALLLCSIRWWSNFVSCHSNVRFIRFLSSVKKDLQPGQHIVQGYASMWRIFIFIIGVLLVGIYEGISVKSFFSPKLIETYEIKLIATIGNVTRQRIFSGYFSNILTLKDCSHILIASNSTPLYVLAIQAISTAIMYQSCKFAYRTHMHQFGFALPTNLVSLSTICLIVALCATRNKDVCAFHGIVPDYLFFDDSALRNWKEFLSNWYVWCWATWLMSQIWITIHLWTNENERLALVEKIFSTITYDSLMIDQCLALNRKTRNDNIDKDGKENGDDGELRNGDVIARGIDINVDIERIEEDSGRYDMSMGNDNHKDRITRIYACATMWHEERDEMDQLVGSILRLDKDHCAMRVTQKYYKVQIKDYYELETHIFFDDAFCCMHGCAGSCNHNENETQVNQYVTILVETVQRNVENLCMRFSPPTKYPTPYGGRLVWTLPGKTQLVVHLKDKNKIRHRKRWSQVMYMYYLLGYRLMGLPIDVDRKEIIAENTYILTLDGDIDFRPSAVKVLVDLMKKDRDLGAACGRIHPVGTGPIVWFQKFEYAIGHWLQKSTEHTIGCVLCSPGCFSLFRAKALMQHNVMAKYATKSTEARHYIQYDQGEDRWLCTLILQVGSRVEYSAASDAYTHAPEVFQDFYIQRRRWIPSTVANIFDLLLTAKETRKVNNDISWLYIVYQWILIGSTILGPGTIFLMLVGAFVAAFRIDNWTSFWYNLIPICAFVGACFIFKERMQLLVAQIISAIYGLVMIVVLVGIMLQIAEDGWFAPSSLLFFIVAGQLIIAGLLHPQEWTCLVCGIIYYITVPSMYMLLIIFSIFNVHNVTWGTREAKKTAVKKHENDERSAGVANYGLMMREGSKQNKKQNGSLEFSFGNLLKCICCLHAGIGQEEERLNEINESLRQINARLKLLDRLTNTEMVSAAQSTSDLHKCATPYFPTEETTEELHHDMELHELQRISDKDDHENGVYNDVDEESDALTQTSATSSQEHSSFLISPYWLQDERMRKGEVDFLSNSEEEFWKDLIEKYLRPIESDEESQNKIAQELMSCRDAYLLKFFMINALFVLIVFLMQLNKETLHLQWPLGMKYNITYVIERNEVRLEKEYLRLEPIGCLFIIAFISILGIQFLAMLIHRFDTFSHVLANKNLKLPCWNKMISSSESGSLEKHADEIAQGLQRVAENEMIYEFRQSIMTSPSRRKTIHELTENAQPTTRTLGNFEKLFRRKLHEPNISGLSRHMSSRISKNAINAFERRRSTILAEKKKRQTQKLRDIYDDADNLRRSSNNHTSHSLGQLNISQLEYDNPGFRSEENI